MNFMNGPIIIDDSWMAEVHHISRRLAFMDSSSAPGAQQTWDVKGTRDTSHVTICDAKALAAELPKMMVF